jgi:hypothetical protein
MLVGCYRKNAGSDETNGNLDFNRDTGQKLRLSHPSQIALGLLPVCLSNCLNK